MLITLDRKSIEHVELRELISVISKVTQLSYLDKSQNKNQESKFRTIKTQLTNLDYKVLLGVLAFADLEKDEISQIYKLIIDKIDNQISTLKKATLSGENDDEVF